METKSGEDLVSDGPNFPREAVGGAAAEVSGSTSTLRLGPPPLEETLNTSEDGNSAGGGWASPT